MAKRSTRRASSERRDMTKFCAFWGLAIAAVLYIVRAILHLINNIIEVKTGALGTCMMVLDILGRVALIVAIALPAYSYVRGRTKGWKIFYWVALIVFSFCIVFNAISF